MFHYFKGFIACLYVVILSCMLVSDMTVYLVFSTPTSKPVSLLATIKAAALLGAFARLRKATVSFVTFVCPSFRHATTRLLLNGFLWHLIHAYVSKICRKFRVHYNRTRITGTLQEDQNTFLIITRSGLLGMSNVSGKIYIANQNTILSSITFLFFFFSKIVSFMRRSG